MSRWIQIEVDVDTLLDEKDYIFLNTLTRGLFHCPEVQRVTFHYEEDNDKRVWTRESKKEGD